jgi:hypothetical protein
MQHSLASITTGTPRRVAMFDANTGRWLATFTVGARTVLLRGRFRTLKEGPHRVRHAHWVRLYPRPFREDDVDRGWLAEAMDANACGDPDVLAIAMQYIGDASYGPLIDGEREEGADFNDYLGVPWQYDGEPADPPERRQFRCLDCSGYVRMVFGYRGGVPLSRAPRKDRSALPRRAHEMASHAPGVVVVPPSGRQITAFDDLAPGDLVFFDADRDDGPRSDHVGLYLGTDTARHHRFLSSRKTANGPTMGDAGGRSTLDGDGLYARAFRAVRRL